MDSAFTCYQKYLALKAHFERDDYCYIKFRGKTNAKVTSFERRKDKYFFAKLVKKPHYEKLLIANMVDSPGKWIGELIDEDSEEVYKAWSKRVDHLGYVYQQELKKLNDNFNSNFIVPDGGHPPLLILHLQKDISLETLCILNALTGFGKRWNKQIVEQYVWPAVYKKMVKYTPFLSLDEKKLARLKATTIERFS